MSAAGFHPDRLERIGHWMSRYVDERKYAGASVLIRQGGAEVYFRAAGLRDCEAGLPFERDTVARIFSMSKPITSVALMMLVEQGLFPLEAPVSEFIPAFRDMTALVPGAERPDQVEPAPTPTLHQLLTHTSGLSYFFNPGIVPEEMALRKIQFGPKQGPLSGLAEAAAGLPLAFQPGSRWEYSIAIDILGRVIEVASGQSLDRFLSENIFQPLGMHETGFSVPDAARGRFAALYTPLEGNSMALNSTQMGADTLRLEDNPETSPYLAAETFSGGGGLVGTLDDYMRFAEMLRQGGQAKEQRLLSAHTLEFMMMNHLPGDIASMGPQSFAEQPMEGVGFGLGGSVVLNPARARVPGHVGDFSWGGMASTFFWVDRAADMSVVFFTQLSPSSSYPARAELKALVHGAMR